MAVDANDSRRRRPQGVGVHGFQTRGADCWAKPVDYVFVGSCTNGRIEDLRRFARLVEGRRKADNITAWIVPGSKGVEAAARAEGLDQHPRRRGFRTPPAGLFGVPGDERRQDPGGQIQRFDLEPQFRGPAGSRRPYDAVGCGRCRRRRGDGRDFRSRAKCSICKRLSLCPYPNS